MAESDDFAQLMARVRSGDVVATRELIQRYEPAIRREARLRLGPSLRPLFDSMDLCQSVLGSFFVRAVAGDYHLESPGHLFRLLIVMTRNKVREKARRRRENSLEGFEPVALGMNPVDQFMHRDFLVEFQGRLSVDESALWEHRRLGRSWQEIAAEVGGTPESLRQRFSRSLNRVARELGLEAAE